MEDDKTIQLDDYFLKIFAEMLKIIKEQKGLLKKIMRDLMDYIRKITKPTYSLIHERAFAMTAMTYLQGSLNKLQ